jgi:hypothetical protein
LVAAHGPRLCRHALALTLDRARDSPTGYLLRCIASPQRIPYSEAQIRRTIRRHRVLRSAVLGRGDRAGEGMGRGGGDPGPADGERPVCADGGVRAADGDRTGNNGLDALWRCTVAELSTISRGMAQALAGSRLASIGADGTAVVRVRERHTAANERLRALIARRLAAVARSKGREVCGLRLEVAEKPAQ